MNKVINTLNQYLPSKRKGTPSGWISFNAPCCPHNGHPKGDKRQRGGLLIKNDMFVYHCFNCKFKTGWKLGSPLGIKTKKLLSWFNIPEETINDLIFYALEYIGKYDEQQITTQDNDYIKKFELPKNSKPINEWLTNPPRNLLTLLDNIIERRHPNTLLWYDYYWTDDPYYSQRLIIPIKYSGKILGYTSRYFGRGIPNYKYISSHSNNILFNADELDNEYKNFIILTEGPFDAIICNGVSPLGNELNEYQIDWLNNSGKEVILVPDRDRSGKGLIKTAIKEEWSVSFPKWKPGIKDVDEAVREYGRIKTVEMIYKSKVTGEFQIRFKENEWL